MPIEARAWIPRLAGDGPMYRQIVQELADAIATEELEGGEWLLPHRELADRLGVARGTVAKAYATAEELGLVRSQVGRGTCVVDRAAGERPYSTMLEPRAVRNDLSTNLPMSGIDLDPAEALRRLAERPDRRALLQYQEPAGLARHRYAGSRWIASFGVEASEREIVICAGAQHALFVSMAHLCAPGDAVAVEEWSYPGLRGIAQTLRLRLLPIRMDTCGLDPDDLERVLNAHAIRALYCMPTVHNPMGIVTSRSRRARIAELADEHDLFVIEDAAHRLFAKNPPPAFRSLIPGRTFFVASTSKVLGPGLRVAFLAAPPAHSDGVSRKVWATQWMVSPLNSEVFALWQEAGLLDACLSKKRSEAARRQKLARSILAPFELRAHPHALHVWIELPDSSAEARVVERARERNVGVTAGSAFWMRSTRQRVGGLRLALGGVSTRAELTRGLKTLAKTIAQEG